jgi:DNA-binding SARP family transcriptional activator/tetratricopeptide (TPR) repeat protein
MRLLAYLALHPEPVARATVAAALWPDELDAAARSNLRRHLHLLRRCLPGDQPAPWLIDKSGAIGWNFEAPASIDIADYMRLVGDAATRSQALELVTGDLLRGFDDEWLVVERERLRSRYLEALFDEAVARRRDRDFAGAAVYAERLLIEDELREDAVREIMAARYQAGDRGSALATYDRFTARLSSALGVAPDAETTALAAAMRVGAALFDEDAAELHAHAEWKPVFSGRSTELATLRRAWIQAARGNGTTIFVGGEAGIGKSRCVAEFLDIVRAAGGRVVTGTTSDPEAEPYQPLFSALRRLLPFAAGLSDRASSFSTLAGALPELRSLVRPSDANTGARNEEIGRGRLFDELADFVEHVARLKPLLLVVEDIHWSGEATIDALDALARRIGALPVLIVATYRTEETPAGHPLRDLRARLAAVRRGSSIVLRPLDPSSVREMLAQTDTGTIPPDVADAICRISGGNPLFATQLTRSFYETGALPATSGSAAMSEYIALRIARIAPDVRSIGEAASIVGEHFAMDIVSQIGGWNESDVMDALGHLMDAAIIRESSSAGYAYAFTHALIAEAMYASMPAATRAARHHRIAQLLERSSVRDRSVLEAIARHWNGAGDRSRASAAYTQSALAALEVFARSDAIVAARRAAELAEDDVARFGALRIAAAAPARGGERDGWEADLEQLSSVAERLGDEERFEAMALREACHWQSGRPEQSAVVIEQMVGLSERTGLPTHRAIAFERWSRADVAAGHLNEAIRHGRKALAAAEIGGDPVIVNRLRALIASIALRLGDLVEAATLMRVQRDALADGGTLQQRMDLARSEAMLAVARQDGVLAERSGTELLALARTSADREYESLARSILAYAAHERYDANAVRHHYAIAETLYRQLGRTQALVVTTINRAMFEADIGRHDVALELWAQALPQAQALSMRPSVGYLLAHRSGIELLRGDEAAAVATARAACDLGTGTGERRMYAESLVALGAALSGSGEHDAGIRTLHDACAELKASGADRLVPEALALLIEALISAGRLAEAAGAASELSETFYRDTEQAERYPARLALALAHEAEVRGDAAASESARTRGRRLLADRLALLGADSGAYAELGFNRELLQDRGVLL